MTDDQLAEKCFVENIKLFASAQTAPEKFNLYRGLAALAETARENRESLSRIERMVKSLISDLQHKGVI